MINDQLEGAGIGGDKPESQYDAHIKTYGKFQQDIEDRPGNLAKLDKDAMSGATSDLGSIKSLMGNPQGFMINIMTKFAPVLAPILIAVAMPMIIKGILDILAQPGNPLDPRFKRLLENEFNSGLTRQQQFNTAIGARKITVQSAAGWRNMMGAGHTSNMRDIKDGSGFGPRKGKVGIEAKKVGLRTIG